MLVCKYCGSSEALYVDAWVDVNTQEVVNTFDDYFCDLCEKETTPIAKSEYKRIHNDL